MIPASQAHFRAVSGPSRAPASNDGSRLVQAIQEDLRAEGVRVLQVHTVGPSYPSPAYARTREFYQSLGFIPLQEFEGIDWSGPTLVLVKSL
jgi:N-acetylglutamate synthase-like GNAT family acetyltransferase